MFNIPNQAIHAPGSLCTCKRNRSHGRSLLKLHDDIPYVRSREVSLARLLTTLRILGTSLRERRQLTETNKSRDAEITREVGVKK